MMLSPFSTVLVVDDNPMARATAVHLFQDFGFEVLDAYSGAAAMRLIEAHPEIGLLFVDVRMPGMSGLELAQAAQKAPRPHLKIVFTSGYVDRCDVPADAAVRAKTLACGRSCSSHFPRRPPRRRVARSEPEALKLAVPELGSEISS